MSLPGYVVVEAFPFNGPDDADSTLVPVDITGFVNDNLQIPAPASGRQTDLQSVDPGPFTVTLNNGVPGIVLPPVTDSLARSVSNGWGTADTGQAWTLSGGAAADYSVNGAAGVLSLGSVNVARSLTVAATFGDFDIRVDRIGVTAAASGAPFDYALTARISGSDFVDARLFANPGGTFTMAVRQVVGGIETFVGFPTVPMPTFAFPAFRFSGVGHWLQAKAWEAGQPEPATWLLGMVTSHTTAGPVGLSALLEAGNTNSLPVLVDWSNFSAQDPFSMSDLFTPANVLSPLCPGWRTSMRLRMRETVGFRTYTLADGNLLQPAVTIQTPGADQTVSVTAVDRIGRLQQGRKFVSTLTEWIRYNATHLVAHWPLVEASGTRQAAEVTGLGQPLLLEGRYIGQPATTSAAVFTFGSVPGPTGDDGQYPAFNPGLNSASDTVQIGNRLAARTLGLTLSGTSYAVVGWVRADPTNVGSYQTILLHDNAGTNTLQIGVALSGAFQIWQLSAATAGGNVVVPGPIVRFGRWQLLGARITLASGVADLWVDDYFTGSAATGGAASGATDILVVQGDSPGTSVGQAQVYLGGDYTHAAFLAQYAAGLSGLSGQYAGDRIVTIGRYAGIPAGELGAIDQGASMMGGARLAGRTALDAMRDAEAAEQGLLHAAGRQLIFHSRVRRYNR